MKANELNEDFLKKIKAFFKGKRISITIEEQVDETEYLLATEANRKHLEESLKSKEGFAFTLNEFKKYSRDVAKGKKVATRKLRKVKHS